MKSIVLILFLSYLTSSNLLCSSSSCIQDGLDTLKVLSSENQNEPPNKDDVCWRFYLKQENESITDYDISFLSEQNNVIENRISKTPEMVFIILDVESLKLLEYKSIVECKNRQFT